MDWRPKVIWGTPPTTIIFDLPQRPWTPTPNAVGGRRIAASGSQASYKVRQDELVEKRIRFSEEEWPSVRDWLVWAQGSDSFAWYDEQTDTATVEVVYLHAPEMGQAIRPERDGQFPLVFEISITLRLAHPVSGISAATRPYFEPPGILYAFLVAGDFYVFRFSGITGLDTEGNTSVFDAPSEFRVLQSDRTGAPWERLSGFVVLKE